MSLYRNINKRKKAGTSRSKKKSTISAKAYANMKAGFPNSKKNKDKRIVLMTTKAKKHYHKFKFKKNDIMLFGRESAGVPESLHKTIKNRIKVPMNKKTRSLNVAMSVAIISAEALRQNNLLK